MAPCQSDKIFSSNRFWASRFWQHISCIICFKCWEILATACKVTPSLLFLPLLSLLFTPLISYFSSCPPCLCSAISFPFAFIQFLWSLFRVCASRLAWMSDCDGMEELPAPNCAWPPPCKTCALLEEGLRLMGFLGSGKNLRVRKDKASLSSLSLWCSSICKSYLLYS